MSQQLPPREYGSRRRSGRRTAGEERIRSRAPDFSGMAGRTLEEGLTGDMRLALHDFVQSATVAEWCANECLDEGPEMRECVRLCRDVADLAALNVQFIARDSPFGPDVAEAFAVAAEEAAAECAGHSLAHCQDCADTLYRAADSTWEMLDAIDREGRREPRQAELF